MQPTSRPHARGFTVVELLLVITVIGILSVVAVARLNDRAELDAQGYAQQVASGLRFAHAAAVAQRRAVYVNFDVAGGRVRACLDADPGCAQPLAAPSGGHVDLVAPAGVTLASGAAQFFFDARGRPSLAASLAVSASGGGASFGIVIERETGYVRKS
jgi:MSHA pilin protein MshC